MGKGISVDKLKVSKGQATLRVLNRESMTLALDTLTDLDFSVLLTGDPDHDALIEKAFKKALRSSVSEHTLKTNYDGLKQYCWFCREENLRVNEKGSLVEFYGYLRAQLMTGTYTSATCQSYFKRLVGLLAELGLPAKQWTHRLGKFQAGPGVEAYDDTEMRSLIRCLMAVFNQLAVHLADPERKDFVVTHDGVTAKLKGNRRGSRNDAFNKVAYSAYYLTTYFTAANQAPLTQAIRENSIRFERDGSRFVRVEGIKWRAGKEVEYAFGIAKHAKRILKAWLEVSEPFDAEPLFFVIGQDGDPKFLDSKLIAKFAQWLQKSFNIRRADGTPLVITARALRTTGRNRFLARTRDPLKVAQLMQHAPRTGDRHYGAGNQFQNDIELQATSHALSHSAIHRKGIDLAKQHAREQLQIDVLPYDEFVRRHTGSQATEIGTQCKEPFGDKAEKFTKRARKAGLIATDESLACADFIKCFQCANCAVIEEEDDLWCLLSFREALDESKAFHISADHHQSNFGEVVNAIDATLDRVKNRAVLDRARKKTEFERHPLWPEHTDVLDVLGGAA